jgi:hypothetical protein
MNQQRNGKVMYPMEPVPKKTSFIMKPDGHAWLFAANLNDGFPEYYEPLESPVNNFMSSHR